MELQRTSACLSGGRMTVCTRSSMCRIVYTVDQLRPVHNDDTHDIVLTWIYMLKDHVFGLNDRRLFLLSGLDPPAPRVPSPHCHESVCLRVLLAAGEVVKHLLQRGLPHAVLAHAPLLLQRLQRAEHLAQVLGAWPARSKPQAARYPAQFAKILPGLVVPMLRITMQAE